MAEDINGLPDDEFAPVEAACPRCGERQVDALNLHLEDESVDCVSCGNHYYLPGSIKRQVFDAVDERLAQLRDEGRL
jgi:Zn ribbon nucleic-acid-binding protein